MATHHKYINLFNVTHPRPLPGQSRRGLPLVEEGLGSGREQGILEEATSTQAGPLQLVKALTLEIVDLFGHCGWTGEASDGKKKRYGTDKMVSQSWIGLQ